MGGKVSLSLYTAVLRGSVHILSADNCLAVLCSATGVILKYLLIQTLGDGHGVIDGYNIGKDISEGSF